MISYFKELKFKGAGLQKLILILVVQFFMLHSVFASQVTLKCTTSSGSKAADLTIDIENLKMLWGSSSEYDIINLTDTYISAYKKPDSVGGEIWVINRISGIYKRGAVGIYCSNKCGPNDKQIFDVQTYEGRCVKQQF